MVRVAFERVELDAVQLLEALPAALAREVVLHLGRVLLHVPVERRALPALVATDLAPAGSRRATPGAGSAWGGAALGAGAKLRGPDAPQSPWGGPALCPPRPRLPPCQPPVTHCRGVSPVCVRRCTSRWFFLLKDLPQVSQVNSRTPGGDAGLSTAPSGAEAAGRRPGAAEPGCPRRSPEPLDAGSPGSPGSLDSGNEGGSYRRPRVGLRGCPGGRRGRAGMGAGLHGRHAEQAVRPKWV